MNAHISTRDDHPFVAIMAFPDKWLSVFDVEKLFKAQDTVSWDTPCFITKAALATDSFKGVEHDAYPGRNKAAAIDRKVLIRNVANETTNKGVNLQCHVTGYCLRKSLDFGLRLVEPTARRENAIGPHDGLFSCGW